MTAARVVLPLLLAGIGAAQEDGLATRVTACLDRARPALREHLRTAHGAELALVGLAALHDRFAPDDEALSSALERLARAGLEHTYGLSLRLQVLAECPWFPDRDATARRDLDALLALRNRAGGFGYEGEAVWWDLSNTQYAALGLRAATQLGLPVGEHVWLGMLDAVRSARLHDGGFVYRAGGSRPASTVSMTAAALVVLEVALQNVDLPRNTLYWRLREERRDAWSYLDAHADAIADPGTVNCLYFHNALERAAILSAVERVGGKDWYARGAEMLFAMQDPVGGGFRSRTEQFRKGPEPGASGHPVDTAFAVLFLRRRFHRDAPETGPPTYVSANLPADADEEQLRRAVRVDVDRGADAMSGVLRALRGEVAVRRRAAIEVVRRLAGQDFGYDPSRPADANAGALRRIEVWWRGAR